MQTDACIVTAKGLYSVCSAPRGIFAFFSVGVPYWVSRWIKRACILFVRVLIRREFWTDKNFKGKHGAIINLQQKDSKLWVPRSHQLCR